MHDNAGAPEIGHRALSKDPLEQTTGEVCPRPLKILQIEWYSSEVKIHTHINLDQTDFRFQAGVFIILKGSEILRKE